MTVWNKGLKGFNRPKRQARYNDLLALGFMPFEARELSTMPRSIPYLKKLAAERYAEKTRWLKSGKTEAEFKTHIRRRYPMKGWGKANNRTVAWAMLREIAEKPYKEKHPEYVRGYPKKSHHKDITKTHHKLNSATGKRDYDTEIEEKRRQIATFLPDAPIVKHLETEIKRIERERNR